MEEKVSKVPAPPYVPYKTFRNFLDRFKQGVPGRVDRGVMNGMSGAVQSQVKTALRYLNLISDHDLPSDAMKRLCRSDGEDRKAALQEIIKAAYPYIFGESHIDFATATGSQLREQIEKKTTASGETVNRCLAFLKDASLDAGMQVSPYVRSNTRRSVGARKSHTKSKQANRDSFQPDPANQSPEKSSHAASGTHKLSAPAQESLLLWGLFQRLPKPGSSWPRAERDQWTQTLSNVLTLEYKE